MAADDVVPCGLSAYDIMFGTAVILGIITELELVSEFKIIADVLLTNDEVVKPDTPPPRADRRMSPTKPSTTSEAPLSMLYPAGKA